MKEKLKKLFTNNRYFIQHKVIIRDGKVVSDVYELREKFKHFYTSDKLGDFTLEELKSLRKSIDDTLDSVF